VTRPALAALAVLAAAAAPAQSPSPPAPFTLEVDVGVVSMTAVVEDKDGRPIRGLGAKDVVVLEDGVPQELTYFREAKGAQEDVPLSVVLVLDASGSMRQNVHFMQEAAITFVHKLQEVDKALVVDFNEGVRGSADFTGDAERLEQFVDAIQPWGGTSLYDAIHYGLSRIRDERGRKAIIVFSDGADTTSTLQEDEVITFARAAEATIYTIGIRGDSGLVARSPRGFLRKVAKETGGLFFFPEKVGELTRIFTEISDELHNHYLLGYSPRRSPDNLWRDIEMRVQGRKDAQVRVRKGYFATRKKQPRRAQTAP
jgi:VWFA-related protein